ncbi:MAG: NfeD family protein [Oscillospiraceae bacterium]|nr:NfeD family protein [Oscillospiraceae bacterium]
MPYWGWLIALGIFLLLEAATAQLVTIWFAVGAVPALTASVFDAPPWLQFTLFVVVSSVSLAATRPLVKKLNRGAKTPTNADRALGETAVVTEEINNVLGSGKVTVRGIPWTARSIDGSGIAEGASVYVERIEGVKLIVSSLGQNKHYT